MNPMKFSEMSYTRPDIDALLGQCKALAAKAAGAASGEELVNVYYEQDRKSTRLNSSHMPKSRMPSSA